MSYGLLEAYGKSRCGVLEVLQPQAVKKRARFPWASTAKLSDVNPGGYKMRSARFEQTCRGAIRRPGWLADVCLMDSQSVIARIDHHQLALGSIGRTGRPIPNAVAAKWAGQHDLLTNTSANFTAAETGGRS